MLNGPVVSGDWFWTGSWSGDDKLTTAYLSETNDGSDPSVTINYGYGAAGLRESSQVTGGGTTQPSVYYIYSGDTIIGEVSNATAGTINAAYTWGDDKVVSERRFDLSTPASFWYWYGPQGETRDLTNASGAVVDTYNYAAYGAVIGGTSSGPPYPNNPFQFGGSVGDYTDLNMAGLILCGQRWYAPGYARWLSRDPEGYDGGANLYAYCGGNPVGAVDPDGTDFKDNWRNLVTAVKSIPSSTIRNIKIGTGVVGAVIGLSPLYFAAQSLYNDSTAVKHAQGMVSAWEYKHTGDGGDESVLQDKVSQQQAIVDQMQQGSCHDAQQVILEAAKAIYTRGHG